MCALLNVLFGIHVNKCHGKAMITNLSGGFRFVFCSKLDRGVIMHLFFYVDGSMQDYSNSSALAVELLQSCT